MMLALSIPYGRQDNAMIKHIDSGTKTAWAWVSALSLISYGTSVSLPGLSLLFSEMGN